jgi:hypothetical protein
VTVVMLAHRRTSGCEAASMTQMITNYLSCLVTLKQISVPVEEPVRHFDPTFCGVSVAPGFTIVSVVLLAVGMLCFVHNARDPKADVWPTKRFLVPGAILFLPGSVLWIVNAGVDVLAAIA